MGAGEVVGGMVDVYSKKKEPVRVPFDAEKINKLLGTDISKEEMIGYFKKIDLEFDEETSEVIAPTFRHDLFRIADLAEEVARFYGYDNIPDHTSKWRSYNRKIIIQVKSRAGCT